MEVICAWCQKKLGEKDGEGITHGICDSCLLHHFPDLYDKIKATLEVKDMEDAYKSRR